MFLSFRGQLDATSYEDSKSGLRIEIGKKRSKTGKIGYFASCRQFFLAKKGSNVIRLQFRDQLWNPRIKAYLTDLKLKGK